MKAITYSSYGSPDVLQVTDVSKPVPKPAQVLIRAQAADAHRLVETEQRLGAIVITMADQ